ncbi:MAG: GTP-binding protein [Kofleriaceae bacterium]|nr:GTP-binding protein [Kofleriaceae bacterium]MCL4226938.1 GTP-binding protein [Myxococcales bacterium]
MASSDRVPVTVLTGFLGAGKTTLLNRILTEHHGQRIAVIENEFGEIGIDQALVVNADEEIFEMNNGCICCTVRGDLIRVLGGLMKRRDRFDRILVETTGLANPGPVAQTFFVDEAVRADFVLDGLVTVIDAHNLERHLDEALEARAQVAFADVLVLNKLDLVAREALPGLERRLRAMNGMARLVRGVRGDVPLAEVLDLGGFDLTRALERAPTFLEPEAPFEWAGVYDLPAGAHVLELGARPDPTMSVVVSRVAEATAPTLPAGADVVLRCFAAPPVEVRPGGAIPTGGVHARLVLDGPAPRRFTLRTPVSGAWALYTQHRPEELDLALRVGDRPVTPVHAHDVAPAHAHDDDVTSVGLELDRPVDPERLMRWVSGLLRARGADLYRVKGVFDLAGQPFRLVLQAVHMLLDATSDRPWPPGPRRSQVVFIGRGLDREELTQGLAACQA